MYWSPTWLPYFELVEVSELGTMVALCALGPGYLRNCLPLYNPPRTLRSSGENLLQPAKTRLTTVTQRTFSSVAPRLWNGLPEEIRQLNTLSEFRTAIKANLFLQAYPDEC